MSTQEVVLHQGGAVQAASAFMPVMTMGQAIERRNVIIEATQNLMRPDVDFGIIPGTGNKPGLFQPGADKLCNLFGLSIQYEFVEKVEDWTGAQHGGEPFFYYQVKGRAYRGDYLIGEGIGSCSSWETKYRYRKGERKCPQCEAEAIIKGKAEYGGGWLCFQKKGGCGAKFKDGDSIIEKQDVARRPNPDIADQVNTILKIAVKRAKVATTINATSASEFFTQDVEDFPQRDEDDHPPLNAQAASSAARDRKPSQMRNDSPPPPPPPEYEPDRSVNDHTPRHDPELVSILSGMRDAATCSDTIGRLKDAIVEITGGDADYYRILALHGFENRQMKGKTAKAAKAAAVDLFNFYKKAQASVAEPVGAIPVAGATWGAEEA